MREWAITRGTDPDTCIVIAGYDDEGADLLAAGWTETEWFSGE